MIGKAIRLERIIDRDSHKTIIIPMDHGVTVGPIAGLTNMRNAISSVVKGGANAILMHKGMVRAGHRGSGHDVGLIVHLSGGTSISPDPNAKELVCTVEEALKFGADAVSIHINLGAETDRHMLRQFGQVSERCLAWQMPLVTMMYTRGPKIQDEYDVENVKLAARVGAELGADIVKVVYTGSIDSFTQVVDGCPVPVVIAGGPKVSTEREVFDFVYDGIQNGAIGLNLGRNVWQHDHPVAMVKALRAIIHENASAKEAEDIFEDEKQKP